MKSKFHYLCIVTAAICAVACCDNPGAKDKTTAAAVVLPGEQAPLMDEGQNNVGGTAADRDTVGRAARMKAMLEEMNMIRTVHFNDLTMSDPFIYPDPETETYYLTSSGGRMYKSKDLVMWEGP